MTDKSQTTASCPICSGYPEPMGWCGWNADGSRVRCQWCNPIHRDSQTTKRAPIPVSDDDLVRWEMEADNANPRLGTFNWPLVVRALIAKIRSMQNV